MVAVLLVWALLMVAILLVWALLTEPMLDFLCFLLVQGLKKRMCSQSHNPYLSAAAGLLDQTADEAADDSVGLDEAQAMPPQLSLLQSGLDLGL